MGNLISFCVGKWLSLQLPSPAHFLICACWHTSLLLPHPKHGIQRQGGAGQGTAQGSCSLEEILTWLSELLLQKVGRWQRMLLEKTAQCSLVLLLALRRVVSYTKCRDTIAAVSLELQYFEKLERNGCLWELLQLRYSLTSTANLYMLHKTLSYFSAF